MAAAGGRGGEAAALPAGQPLPRPARPLRGARAAGRPLGGARGTRGRRARALAALRAERRRPAGGRPRPRASGAVYFGIEDDSQALPELQHAADSKHCRNCGHAYVYDAVYLGHMGRYRCPNCGRKRPRAAGGRHARGAARHVGRRRGAAHAGRPARAEPPPPRALQRLQRDRGRGHAARAGRAAGHDPLGARGLRRRVRARGDDPGRRARAVDPAGQEPGRGQRGAAHADPRGRLARPLAGAERPDRRRPRRVLDLGRRLRAAARARAARDLLGHAPRRWRCGSSTPA